MISSASGFDRTVSELKLTVRTATGDGRHGFDRTVSELKRLVEVVYVSQKKGFDRTVSELKRRFEESIRCHVLVLIAPCRN